MYRYVVFDVDGTILDSEEANMVSFQRAAEEMLGRKLRYEDLAFSLGMLDEEAYPMIGITDLEQALRLRNRYYAELLHTVRVFDGICEVLESLRECGICPGIVTCRTGGELRRALAPFEGLYDCFGVLSTAELTARHKPDPEPMEKYLELSGADPREVLYIGDTEQDLRCAAGAGVDFALALWGAYTTAGCEGAAYFLREPREILSLVGGEVKA
ncbi:MAG: HAD family hydrolase [Clostridiales bacterium]|uniref:HAD family hydrolase n=1 Tax=Provencibacterium massiliense TaxID=1841868 RepID=UPI0009A6B67B|nr:HAD family hydrolase [Provencibacterium massiliense]PWM38913.1 MAG: HAD family hydrolase [Clostridiales bacterium]RGB65417.1 HAD family hydrolase [Harryflintia acetispora]